MGNGNSSAITINLDRNNLLYFSDETVSGTIDLNIRQGKLKADEIYIILMGEIGNTTMPVFSHSNSGFLARSSVKPKYHHIPFYSAKVIIVRPVRQKKLIFDKLWYETITKVTKYLTIYPRVNLLQYPQYLLPTTFEKQNITFRTIMRIQYQKDITFKATFNKLGYVPGEIIQFILEMENPRRVLIKRIDLSMVQTCEIGRAAYSLPISRTILPKIRNLKGQQIRQKFSIEIPLVPIPPSYQFRGGIRKIAVVNICYMFQFTVKVEERCICYDVHIPIILGTEPNPDLSQQPTSNSISISYSSDIEPTMFSADDPPPSYDSVVQNIR
ncbi:unnamed protein product [Rotaria sp. Silwood1]|nr:unnamed protein product [Rotaria sp. Silwood1]